jgi:hypothetical protein
LHCVAVGTCLKAAISILKRLYSATKCTVRVGTRSASNVQHSAHCGRPMADLGEVPQRLCYSTRSFYNRPFMYRLIEITHSCCYCSRHVKSSHWCFSHLTVIAGPCPAIDLRQLTFRTSPASSIRHCESEGVCLCGVWCCGPLWTSTLSCLIATF